MRLSEHLCFNLSFVFLFGKLPTCVLVPLFYGIVHYFPVNYYPLDGNPLYSMFPSLACY